MATLATYGSKLPGVRPRGGFTTLVAPPVMPSSISRPQLILAMRSRYFTQISLDAESTVKHRRRCTVAGHHGGFMARWSCEAAGWWSWLMLAAFTISWCAIRGEFRWSSWWLMICKCLMRSHGNLVNVGNRWLHMNRAINVGQKKSPTIKKH